MAEKRIVDQLFFRMTEEGLTALQTAVEFCKNRHLRQVELAHWLYCLIQQPDSDLLRILRFFNLSADVIEGELADSVRNSRSGADGAPSISRTLRDMLREAWIQASVGYQDDRIRTGHVLLAILHDDDFLDLLQRAAPSISRISGDELSAKFAPITAGSPESARATPPGTASKEGLPPHPSVVGGGRTGNVLNQYTEDLTERARAGAIDPVTGRDEEIRQLIRILHRRRPNNPILTGEAGVGKTAIVEGFALRVAQGNVPPGLKAVSVRALDITRLQAGAGERGEFENRLKMLVDEVKAAGDVILFIDEVHNLVGAGGAAGQGDAANILKPALARGELRTIAATTADEYRKFIEEDPALKRRFEEVVVEEPSEATALLMLRPLVASLEKHHGVIIFDEAIAAAVRLSVRYLPARRLPEKAIGVLDTACAAVSVSQTSTPASLEDSLRTVSCLKSEMALLEQEQRIGVAHTDRLARVKEGLARAEALTQQLDDQWKKEQTLVQEITSLRARLRSRESPGATSVEQTQQALQKAELHLKELQGEEPLLLPTVDEQAVAAVIAESTGIPLGRMARGDLQATLKLKQTLTARVVGQDAALHVIASEVRNAEARLKDPNKPIGAFLLAGPSGTGKTETALALAEARYGSERNLIVFNMNEFKEEHTASTLLGAPPGYVGFQKGGLLTEPVRRRPYSVLLLDEIEKAHKSIQEVFLQVLDQGWTKDREGRFIDFRNTILIFTSNAAADRILELCEDQELLPKPAALADAIKDDLRKHFSDPLLGRLTLVPYYPLNAVALEAVMGIKLRKIQERLASHHGIAMTWDTTATQHISDRCTKTETGARLVDSFINNTVVADISQELLQRVLDKRPLKQVAVAAKNNAFEYAFT